MKIREIKKNVTFKIEIDDNEATHLMHVIWFALDYTPKDKMTEYEIELAKKLKAYLWNTLFESNNEVEIGAESSVVSTLPKCDTTLEEREKQSIIENFIREARLQKKKDDEDKKGVNGNE